MPCTKRKEIDDRKSHQDKICITCCSSTLHAFIRLFIYNDKTQEITSEKRNEVTTVLQLEASQRLLGLTATVQHVEGCDWCRHVW